MFEEIVTKDEVKFNDLEKKVFKFVCFLLQFSEFTLKGYLIMKYFCNKNLI